MNVDVEATIKTAIEKRFQVAVGVFTCRQGVSQTGHWIVNVVIDRLTRRQAEDVVKYVRGAVRRCLRQTDEVVARLEVTMSQQYAPLLN